MNKYATLAYKVSLVDRTDSPAMALRALKTMVTMLMKCMKMPLSIHELGISKEDYASQIPNMTDNALKDNCLVTTPRTMKANEIQEILRAIY